MDEPNKAVEETAIGPGSRVQQQIDPGSLLDGISEYDFVELLNPLSVTFVGQAALTTNINAPMPISPGHENAPGLTKTEADIRHLYGFDLRAQAQQSGKTHVINRIPIPSGQTVKLLGNEAKVVLKQLVNAVMQREKKKQLLANKFERRQVEERIVQRRGNVNDILGRSPLSVQEQLKAALNSMDDGPRNTTTQGEQHGSDFPGLNQTPIGAGADSGQGDGGERALDAPGKRGPGRPKATPDA